MLCHPFSSAVIILHVNKKWSYFIIIVKRQAYCNQSPQNTAAILSTVLLVSFQDPWCLYRQYTVLWLITLLLQYCLSFSILPTTTHSSLRLASTSVKSFMPTKLLVSFPDPQLWDPQHMCTIMSVRSVVKVGTRLAHHLFIYNYMVAARLKHGNYSILPCTDTS